MRDSLLCKPSQSPLYASSSEAGPMTIQKSLRNCSHGAQRATKTELPKRIICQPKTRETYLLYQPSRVLISWHPVLTWGPDPCTRRSRPGHLISSWVWLAQITAASMRVHPVPEASSTIHLVGSPAAYAGLNTNRQSKTGQSKYVCVCVHMYIRICIHVCIYVLLGASSSTRKSRLESKSFYGAPCKDLSSVYYSWLLWTPKCCLCHMAKPELREDLA